MSYDHLTTSWFLLVQSRYKLWRFHTPRHPHPYGSNTLRYIRIQIKKTSQIHSRLQVFSFLTIRKKYLIYLQFQKKRFWKRIQAITASKKLIITNFPGFFVNSGTLSPPANRDHSFIFAKLDVSLMKRKCYTRKVWDFSSVESLNTMQNLCNGGVVSKLFIHSSSCFNTKILVYVKKSQEY